MKPLAKYSLAIFGLLWAAGWCLVSVGAYELGYHEGYADGARRQLEQLKQHLPE